MPNPDPLKRGQLPLPRGDRPGGRPPFSSRLVTIEQVVGRRFVRSSVAKRRNKKPNPGTPESDACPVEPNRPLDLSGGAAAALEFDD